MMRRPIAMMMVALALAGGSAEAGVLKGGTWTPTGCGAEPVPPVINGSSPAAYEASVKQARTFQTAAQQYDDCFIKEANADSATINTAATDHQHVEKGNFDKLQADAKAAADRLNKKQ